MVFSEVPDMSDASHDFIQQYQKERGLQVSSCMHTVIHVCSGWLRHSALSLYIRLLYCCRHGYILCCLALCYRRLLLEAEIVTVTTAIEMGTTTTSRRLWNEISHSSSSSMEQAAEDTQQCLQL